MTVGANLFAQGESLASMRMNSHLHDLYQTPAAATSKTLQLDM
jgi:hypothetical protein